MEMPGCSLCMGNQAQVREGATVMSTSTRNFPNRLGKNTNVYLGSAELAAICSKLGRIPTVAEYHADMGVINKDARQGVPLHELRPDRGVQGSGDRRSLNERSRTRHRPRDLGAGARPIRPGATLTGRLRGEAGHNSGTIDGGVPCPLLTTASARKGSSSPGKINLAPGPPQKLPHVHQERSSMPNAPEHAFAPTHKSFKTGAGRASSSRCPNWQEVPQCQEAAGVDSYRAGIGAAQLRRPEGHARERAALANWAPNAERTEEIPFVVTRVVLQDFTGVPLLADLAAMRTVAQEMGKPPKAIEPLVPVDLVVDHSVMVDHYGTPKALDLNMKLEFQRNNERYQFMKWGMQAFDTFGVVPPGFGIVHQVNLEYFARGVTIRTTARSPRVLP